MIEYWGARDHSFPHAAVTFQYKMETDLFALAKAKATAYSLAVSADGNQFAAYCSDRQPIASIASLHHGCLQGTSSKWLTGLQAGARVLVWQRQAAADV